VAAFLRQWLDAKIARNDIDANTVESYRHHIER
jgi:site-specific recombinase XerD